MSKKTLSDHVIDVLHERGYVDISCADIDILGEAYKRSGGKIGHPLDRNIATMAAVRRSDKFQFDGFIRACDGAGRNTRLATYKIKGAQTDTP